MNTCDTRRKSGLFVSAAVLALGTATVVAPASQAAAVDFSGKRITITVPFSEGGGTDSYSRFMAPYFEKHLPGNPSIVIVNRPGGGGLTGVNYFTARAENDGTSILALSTSSLSNYMLGDRRAKFDVKDFVPVILSPRGITQYYRSSLPIPKGATLAEKIKILQKLPKEQLVFGGKTPTSGGLALRVALSQLGIEVNSVWGLGGNGPMALAFERGEFTLSYDNTLSFLNNRAHMIKSGLAVPLYTFGIVNEDGSISRDPALPDVATFVEAYEAVYGKKPSGPDYEAWKALMAVSVPLSKSWNLPAGTPTEVVEAWRDAARKVYAEVMRDPRGQKIFGPYPNIMTDAAKRIFENGTKLDRKAARWLAGYVDDRFDVTIAAKTR
jgi:tripartite-type tricarboxylate transporter receptor subunit TctC